MTNDTMKRIKDLKKSLKTVKKKEKTITEESSIKTLVQNKEYDKAIERLNFILDTKKNQLKLTEERNLIYKQIDILIE